MEDHYAQEDAAQEGTNTRTDFMEALEEILWMFGSSFDNMASGKRFSQIYFANS